jgi:hypothetical protein
MYALQRSRCCCAANVMAPADRRLTPRSLLHARREHLLLRDKIDKQMHRHHRRRSADDGVHAALDQCVPQNHTRQHARRATTSAPAHATLCREQAAQSVIYLASCQCGHCRRPADVTAVAVTRTHPTDVQHLLNAGAWQAHSMSGSRGAAAQRKQRVPTHEYVFTTSSHSSFS